MLIIFQESPIAVRIKYRPLTLPLRFCRLQSLPPPPASCCTISCCSRSAGTAGLLSVPSTVALSPFPSQDFHSCCSSAWITFYSTHSSNFSGLRLLHQICLISLLLLPFLIGDSNPIFPFTTGISLVIMYISLFIIYMSANQTG